MARKIDVSKIDLDSFSGQEVPEELIPPSDFLDEWEIKIDRRNRRKRKYGKDGKYTSKRHVP